MHSASCVESARESALVVVLMVERHLVEHLANLRLWKKQKPRTATLAVACKEAHPWQSTQQELLLVAVTPQEQEL